MEIRDPQEFLRYFGKVHQRTMNVVGAIPPDKVDWGFRPDKFTLGDLVRHIAASNRYIFLEVAKGNRSSYHGCGKEYGASYDEIVAFTERLHRESIETLSRFTAEDLQRRCTTPDGASIAVWKWLRSMVEHEIHHRGQIYIYLSLLQTPAPPIYGLTSEQVWERSIGDAYDGRMTARFLEESLSVLARTPTTLNTLLRDLPEAWTSATEGPNTWSPYVIIGHLIHGEKADWMPRLAIILKHGLNRPFDPFDREAQFRESQGKSLSMLLDEFSALRHENLRGLRTLNLQPEQFELLGTHPALGPVTVRQLLATWTAHDLAHLVQITRVMAKRYKRELGPWAQYLSIMT